MNAAALVVRPVRPLDRDAAQRFVMALSPASRYRRFHVGLRALPPATLERLTQVDQHTHVALVAEADGDDGPQIVADARYVRLDATRAEFAVAVADAWQGQGLGSRLLRRLARHAAANGLRTLVGDVLADNTPMLRLLERLGADIVPDATEPGLVQARIDVQARCAAASSCFV